MAIAGMSAGESAIGRRIDEAPVSARRMRMIGLVGAATFFDAVDALAIAFVLPILAGLWMLKPQQIGLTISAGYVGQLIGALALGWLAEARGRMGALRIAIWILSIFSLACAFAWSLPALMLARLLQGIGLGGEVPIAATYVNEWAPSRLRGRVIFLFQSLFALGVAVTGLIAAAVTPHWGWRSLFVLGAIPALLFLLFGRRLPESPRWLAERGRPDEAQQVFETFERGEPVARPSAAGVASDAKSRPSFGALFRDGYASRTLTVWLILFCTSAVGYGLLTWMPTLYRTVYHLPIEQTFRYSALNNGLGLLGSLLGAFVIDRLGRKVCFVAAFLGAAAPLLVLWLTAGALAPVQVMGLATVAVFSISILLAGIYVYAPEIYPTRIRALGASTATAWYRLAAIVSPTLVGVLLARFGVSAVYMFFAVVALAGAVVVALFAIETRGRSLEEIAA